MSIPALGHGKIEVPVRITCASMFETIPKFMQTGIAPYNFNGNIQTRLFKLPCNKVGELKLPYISGSLI